MSQITVVLALASPLLHARLRAELALDPGIRVLHDTGNAVRAIEETALLRPDVLMVDRDMIVDTALADARLRIEPMPAVVLVTVYREGIPTRHVLPIAGILPYDTKPGNLAVKLGDILRRAVQPAPIEVAAPAPVRSELQHRFTEGTPQEIAAPKSEPVKESGEVLLYIKQPEPSKTSHLAKAGFLRSVFGAGGSSGREGRAKSGRL
jgi:DNA-binding NarL/FixJ family response regulator